MNNSYKIGLAAIAASLALVGCGGGSSSSTPATVTGQFVDAYVAGLNYTCDPSGKADVTNDMGEYTCNTGDTVTFSLGAYVLGTATASSGIVTPYDIKPGDDETAAINVARLLQSLDTNDTDGIITIPDNFTALDNSTVELNATFSVFEVGIIEDLNDSEITDLIGSEAAQLAMDTDILNAQTDMLTALLAGKTLYNVGSDSTGDNWIDSLVFNADATSLEWSSLTITESGTHGVVVEADKIILSGGDIVGTFELTFLGETADKLVFQGLDTSGAVVEEDFMFFDQATAEAYYDSLQPVPDATPPVETTIPEIEALTNKNDIWIIKNINQAEIDRLKTYAIDQMWFDPSAATYTGDVSCGSLGGYGLQSATPETLTGGTITSATGIEALTYKLADDTFYCKEYTLPADANNNGASSYGDLTFAIAGWNNAIDQSLHTTYLSGTSTSTPVVDTTPESALETFVSGKEFSLDGGAMYPTFHANYDYYDDNGAGDTCSGTWSVVSSNMISVATCGVNYEFNGELVDGMIVTLHFTDPGSTEQPMDVTFTELK